jgi:5'-3' exonuclease
MVIHLIDGTYELFRHFYGLRRFTKGQDRPFGAVVGVLNTVLQMIEEDATHLAVATDHVIESFRNELWSGYKTSGGIAPPLLEQFQPLEDALAAMGVVVWPMTDFEADDALASAASIAAADVRVQKVCVWTPDKDLAQCVRADRVVQLDRRTKVIRDADGVRAKFGVSPELIPDYLALVGDSADGFPGIAGIGPKGAATLIARYGKIEVQETRNPTHRCPCDAERRCFALERTYQVVCRVLHENGCSEAFCSRAKGLCRDGQIASS